MEDKSNKRFLIVISAGLLTFLMCGFVVPKIFGIDLPTEILTPLAMIASQLVNNLKDASAFEFGDSKGSQAKAEAAQRQQVVTGDALKTANNALVSIATGTPMPEPPKEKPDA